MDAQPQCANLCSANGGSAETLKIKSEVADGYRDICEGIELVFVDGAEGMRPNYWLNAVVLRDRARNEVITTTNDAGVMSDRSGV